MLTCEDCADKLNEGLQLSELVASNMPKEFCLIVVEKFDGYIKKCSFCSAKGKGVGAYGEKGVPRMLWLLGSSITFCFDYNINI